MRTHESAERTHHTPPASSVRNSSGPRTLAGLQSTLGNTAVSQMITVSRMMTEGEFKKSTSSLTSRDRSQITVVDNALRAFYALPDTDQRGKLFALKGIVRACHEYTVRKPDGSRAEGTEQLRQQAEAAQGQLDLESIFQGLLTEIDGMENPDHDTQALATKSQGTAQVLPAERFQNMMNGFVQKLGALRVDESLPELTRTVIDELMNVVHLVAVMRYPLARSGMTLNPATDGGDPTFTFNVDTQALGGTSFLLGHIAHELTHVAAQQAFDSSPVMELVQSGTTDAEVAKLAAERKQVLGDLRQELAENTEFNGFQERMLSEKLVYGAQPHKLESYANNFARQGKITDEQRERLVRWGKAAGDASGTLVEYDTVLNQMLIYLHMWETSQDNPFYVKLRAAAETAYNRRSHARRRTDQPTDQPADQPADTSS
ncbi:MULTISPECIES: hypothetical protein [unclassified Streptomyces]|uniref:hypothetical protein n=1 Tax=unclassified Streptomyces TaxID=2593676 RepID=UPI0036E58ABA